MSKLVMALHLSSTAARIISVSQPPYDYAEIFDKDWDVGFRQGFIWYPHCVTFLPPGDVGGYWIEIYTSDVLNLQPDTAKAIAVPFTIPGSNQFYVSASDDVGTAVSLSHGNYQLLFESRSMTALEAEKLHGFEWCLPDPDEELEADEAYEVDEAELSAEVIRFTFIPSEELPIPEILKPESEPNIAQNLQLNPHIETSEKVSRHLVPPGHSTPEMLDFISIIEQTLKEFYAKDDIRCRPKSSAVLEDWHRFKKEKTSELWIGVYGTPGAPNLCLQEPYLWIRIDSAGDVMFGAPVGGPYNTGRMTGSCIWRLKHGGGDYFKWFDAFSCGLKRYDAEILEELLLILKQKARKHFRVNEA